MKIVVIGGTGLIGSKLVTLLRGKGHEVLAASPNSGVNTLTGEGLAEALAGAQVVVDVSNSPSFEDTAVMNFFRTSTTNLLAAEARAGVQRVLVANGDKRQVIGDAHAPYFGAEINDQSLVTGSSARIGAKRFEEWLQDAVAH